MITKDLLNTKTMNSFERVLNSAWLLIIFQLVLLSLFTTNIYYSSKISNCQTINRQLSINNETLNQDLARYDNLEAYENSLSYQERGFRNRGFKLKDEVVIDTAAVEPLPENPEETFIPTEKTTDQNNIISWFNYLSGKKQLAEGVICS